LGNDFMDHSEALKQMAAERYLLNELTPDAREAFEAHFFECPECALDLRAGAVFIDEAKTQLPELTRVSPAPAPSPSRQPKVKREWWLGWLQPAFAAPVFATLLLLIGYQNLVTYPALRASADQPRLLPWAPLHGATRGGAHLAVTADRRPRHLDGHGDRAGRRGGKKPEHGEPGEENSRGLVLAYDRAPGIEPGNLEGGDGKRRRGRSGARADIEFSFFDGEPRGAE